MSRGHRKRIADFMIKNFRANVPIGSQPLALLIWGDNLSLPQTADLIIDDVENAQDVPAQLGCGTSSGWTWPPASLTRTVLEACQTVSRPKLLYAPLSLSNAF